MMNELTASTVEQVRAQANSLARAAASLPNDLAFLGRVAAGEVEHNEGNIAEVAQAVQEVLEALWSNAATNQYRVPPTSDRWWYDAPVGRLLSATLIWQAGRENLINLAEAGQILAPSASKNTATHTVRRLVDQGALRGFVDPTASNFAYAQRVLRSEVEAEAARRKESNNDGV